MADRQALRAYAHQIEAELLGNILPFWMDHAVDRARGGFYGQVWNDGTVDRDARRGALLTSRILWTYAAAYRRYRTPAYLDMARWAYDDLIARFWDEAYGGLYWEIDAQGHPTNPRKQIYGQAFGIYGLAEYYRATAEQGALQRAIALFEAIETHSHDPTYGGYLEAYTRDWRLESDLRLSEVDMNEAKSMNTHLHVMEAYANLMRAWNSPALARAQRALVQVMIDQVIDRGTHHTVLFFDRQWTRRSDHISYGHDIEASWLLVEAVELLHDEPLLGLVRPLSVAMAEATLAEGMDPDGGLLYEASPAGLVDDSKQWWPQAEAVVGLLNAYQLSGRPHLLDAALRSWDFVERHLIDREQGGWFRYVSRDGARGHDEPKVSFWKCPYHNGRACMEAVERLGAISDPETP
ncbi:MAG: AGE family epimerase/isomerase [Anaerolineae bacterium]|nr:AGE family epimerase/isomerase [Anaerolineae bacterium]